MQSNGLWDSSPISPPFSPSLPHRGPTEENTGRAEITDEARSGGQKEVWGVQARTGAPTQQVPLPGKPSGVGDL